MAFQFERFGSVKRVVLEAATGFVGPKSEQVLPFKGTLDLTTTPKKTEISEVGKPAPSKPFHASAAEAALNGDYDQRWEQATGKMNDSLDAEFMQKYLGQSLFFPEK